MRNLTQLDSLLFVNDKIPCLLKTGNMAATRCLHLVLHFLLMIYENITSGLERLV
jgi:hypothetical protein